MIQPTKVLVINVEVAVNYETDHFLMTPGLLRFSSHFFISSNEVYDYIQQSELLLLTVDVSWSEREREILSSL